jgi:hypothetical protein
MWIKKLLLLPLVWGLMAQTAEVLKYPLPDPLICLDGSPFADAATWREKRRPEILQLFSNEVFGKAPAATAGVHFQTDSIDKHALNGLAIRKQVTVFFSADERGPRMHVLLYVPAHARKRVAVFVGLNFFGNETVNADPGIDLPDVWVKDSTDAKLSYGGELQKHHKERALESARGSSDHLWQVEKILEHGFGLATAYCGDVEPDFLGGMEYGVRWTFLEAGQTKPAANEWGALGAWAWGLSRIADYLVTDKLVDSKKIILTGFSRLGKAAMWSAAQDRRFSMVISSESGVGGASLYRATTSESIEHLNTAFPYWFAENFHKYSGHPDEVPVDGNMLLALIAPRPLYVASAEEDHQSDPPAEYLSAVEASKVYRLLGEQGLNDRTMPAVNAPVMNGMVGYHVRSGKHDVTAYDWDQYLAFAEKHFPPKAD